MKAATAIATLLALPGCIGRGIPYEGGKEDEPVPPGEGYTVEGTARDVETGDPPPDGLCASAIDPGPAVTGGDPVILATAPVATDGTFSVPGIVENPQLGIFLGIDDCADAGADVVMNAATGIGAEEVEGKGTGDVIDGVEAVFVTHELEGRWGAELGWPGELGADGFLAGFVVDADGNAVSGAAIGCLTCDRYYRDGDPSDGQFGDGTTFNETTDAAGGALFLIPAAGISNYTCDDGGAHTWEPTLFGSVEGIGAFIQFDAL